MPTRPQWWELIAAPEAVVRYVKETARKIRHAEKFNEKIDFDAKKQIRNIVTTQINKKHADGRIHATGSDGKYAAHSVSPYAPIFEDNLEDGIKDLVMSLTWKCYLTISSCEGHALGEERYVSLCFKSMEEIEHFKTMLPNLPYMRINTYKAEDYLNIEVSATEEEIKTIKRMSKKKSRKDHVTNYFRHMFFHFSEDWYIMRIEIVKKWNKEKDSRWSKTKRWFYKRYQMEKDTADLANHFESIQKYEYFTDDYINRPAESLEKN